jgi:hypothetical protein
MERAAAKVNGALSGPSAEEQSLNQYIDGFNLLVDKAVPCAREYENKVPESGPLPGKEYRFFPHCRNAENSLGKIKASFETAQKGAPNALSSIGASAKSTLESFEALLKVAAEVAKYYESAGFKADQGAQGKLLHERMLEATRGFEENMGGLQSGLAVVEDKRALDDIAKYESEKSYSYWLRKAPYDANKLLKANAGDQAAFAAALSELQSSAAPFKTFVSGKGTSLHGSFKSFADAYDRFDSKAQRYLQGAKEAGKAARLEQDYNQIVQAYNGMVTIANSLRELEAQGLLK